MVRKILNDAQWARIAPELPGKKGDPGKSGTDNRLFVEAVLWVARTGSPWRDLPDDFGKWSTVYTRYWRWAQKDKWESIFKRLSDDPDFEYVMIDSTIVRVHRTHPARTTEGSVFFWSRSSRSGCDDVMDLSLCGVAFLWESSPASKPQ